MLYDYTKLQDRIREKFGSPEKFAEHLGRASVYVYSKIEYPRVEFRQSEILSWCRELGIRVSEIQEYFFTLKENV